jgi:PIN domain nuclease of toxin-antitoxin system
LGGAEVILLDTHIWFWWVQDVDRLSDAQRKQLQAAEADGLAVSVISCWEIAMLVAKQRLVLSDPVEDWLKQALNYPGIRRLQLTPKIALELTRLPRGFSRRPGRSHHCCDRTNP